MMPSDRKFLQRRRSLQLEQSRYNSCVEQSRVFRLKEINSEMKKLRCTRESLERKAAETTTLLSPKEITKIERENDTESLENLRAWSITNYGIIMERSKTFFSYKSRMDTGLIAIEEEGGPQRGQVRGSVTAPSRPFHALNSRETAGVHIPSSHSNSNSVTNTNVMKRSKTGLTEALGSAMPIKKRWDPKFFPFLLKSKSQSRGLQGFSKIQVQPTTQTSPPLTTENSFVNVRSPKKDVPCNLKDPAMKLTEPSMELEESETREEESGADCEEKDKFEELMYYKSKTSGSVLVPNPVHYSAIKSIRPPTPEKPPPPPAPPRVRTLTKLPSRNKPSYL